MKHLLPILLLLSHLGVNAQQDTSSFLNEVVISATIKPMMRDECTLPVEIYHSSYFSKNPTPNLFEALSNVNGVRPQVNCNICNTGDIHINGLEGPYTLILIDGMPIVSALSTVYGLSGIPNSIIERVEIVKGPASTLYGSEAVGGLVNIITKNPSKAPHFAISAQSTSWQEHNIDLSNKIKIGSKTTALMGANAYWYDTPTDMNRDNFTDVTLQKRISLFQKWNIQRKENRLLQFGMRGVYEDRWGGEMQWTPKYRGGNQIYGESIYTQRVEFISLYDLPTNEKITFSFSGNAHKQDSRYGTTSYNGHQNVLFSQLLWTKKIKTHDLVGGITARYTFFDDNTTVTSAAREGNIINAPSRVFLPGIFLQDEQEISPELKLLYGSRIDYHPLHGGIVTPRVGLKWKKNNNTIFRVNAGSGFRTINIFSEDHAALTGAREVVIEGKLSPEKSWNINVNAIKKVYGKNKGRVNIDASLFYTHFNNRIVPDYTTDENKIIYNNLAGYAQNMGASLQFEGVYGPWSGVIGGTFIESNLFDDGIKKRPLLTEKFSGTWTLSYAFKKSKTTIDYTGNICSPMLLPLAGPSDPRPSNSPWWSIQNVQIKHTIHNIEISIGVKNLLNWTPAQHLPFLIANSSDPFDQNLSSPQDLPFDPTYSYAPNQGIRFYAGLQLTIP